MNLIPAMSNLKSSVQPASSTPFSPPILSAEQIEEFRRDGFLAIPRLVDDETLQCLRKEYDRFLRGEVDCGENNRKLGGQIHQILFPNQHSAYFRDNPALAAARGIVAQLFNAASADEVKMNFDQMLNKPPGVRKETPWHQDIAYMEMPFAPAGTPIPDAAGVQFWIALDDVDIDNGCMQFVPGQHRKPLLPHYVAGGEPTAGNRMLAIADMETSRAVACPLPAGGCTVHHYGTPHYTGPNVTIDRNRRAYIFNLAWNPTPGFVKSPLRLRADF